MNFREDINGLRAIAVIAVVLFHFNESWMPGGFAGVDVFFVISGYLMTGIIFSGIEQQKFSILKFYISRANRIIPALAVLCLTLLALGWFYLSPIDYKILGKHSASSIGFLSNVIYWKESGYFDASSHEKWLLHTWSLSVEWQFYVIYPLIIVTIRKIMNIKAIKIAILLVTVLGFIFCIFATYKWPNPSYYLLSTRAWEMMVGGVAYLFPFSLKETRKKTVELLGLTLIIGSYFFISKNNPWPGYLSIFPVLGTFLIIQAKCNNSIITSNFIMQKLGYWSYSIYLWHWPIAVSTYYFSLNDTLIYTGILLSVALGFLSYQYIEKINFRKDFTDIISYTKIIPLYIGLIVFTVGTFIFLENGFINRAPSAYKSLINNISSSPLRTQCHINEYHNPEKSCEYFGSKVTWAVLGDSHSTEIAYSLAERLKVNNIGLKHFTFSGCEISYKEKENFSTCSKWYNESINYILKNDKIKNVVLNHRYTYYILGSDNNNHQKYSSEITDNVSYMTNILDELIIDLARKKENVYIYYPIPELEKNINKLIGNALRNKTGFHNIYGTTLARYIERNNHIIKHFDNSTYPSNVNLLKPQNIFCNKNKCFAVKDGVPLYFDDNHPSTLGAEKLVELIIN